MSSGSDERTCTFFTTRFLAPGDTFSRSQSLVDWEMVAGEICQSNSTVVLKLGRSNEDYESHRSAMRGLVQEDLTGLQASS